MTDISQVDILASEVLTINEQDLSEQKESKNTDNLKSKYENLKSKIANAPYLRLLSLLVIVLVCNVYAMLFLVLLWNPNFASVQIAVINQDTPFKFTGIDNILTERILVLTGNEGLGEYIQDLLLGTNSPSLKSYSFQWVLVDPTYNPPQLVENGKYWAYVSIPANFSNLFLANLNGTSSNLEITFGYDQARHSEIIEKISKEVYSRVQGASKQLGNALITDGNQANNSLLVSPQFLLSPIKLAENNLHPVPNFGVELSSHVSLVILWICNMYITLTTFKIFNGTFLVPIFGNLTKRDTLLVGYGISMLYQFFASLMVYTTTTIVRGNNSLSSNNYSALYFFITLVSSCFFQISVLLAKVFGRKKFALPSLLLLAFQYITSSTILDPAVLPSFASITYLLPFNYGVKGMKCFLMGSQCSYTFWNVLYLIVWLGTLSIINFAIQYKHSLAANTRNEESERLQDVDTLNTDIDLPTDIAVQDFFAHFEQFFFEKEQLELVDHLLVNENAKLFNSLPQRLKLQWLQKALTPK
ncbi:hypothetical protein HDV06_004984 [Boothiomyces sp. JEL0866]|nr:hypothetical protein HDV06_004951 [Boothiomyces sp. JEL0866]KAJ3325227.1 hypothetical protein HDV06_004984 [Boothiomyces sp. JEL0866]